MHLFRLVFLVNLLPTFYSYLVTVSDSISPDTAIFNGTLNHFKQPVRKYFMNIEKSASFVEKLVYVNSSTGDVFLSEQLSCDRSEYPNVFTLYIDSTSSGIYEYISVPLRIYVPGCEYDSLDEGNANLFRCWH